MTGWRTRLEALDRLDPDDDVYRRAQQGPRGPDVAPEPSLGRRVAAAVTAFVVFGAASVFAWSAFRGTGADDRDRLGEASPSVMVVPGPDGTFLWPERSAAELAETQDDADAGGGRTRWRLNATEVAREFANAVLGWPTDTFEMHLVPGEEGEMVATLERPVALCPTPAPEESSPDICYGGLEEVHLAQPVVEGDGGVWVVSSVAAPDLDVGAGTGQLIQNGSPVAVAAEIPEGLNAVAGANIGHFGEPNCLALRGKRLQSADSTVSVFIEPDRQSGMACGEQTPGYIYVATASWHVGQNSDPLVGDSSPYVALTAVPITVAIPENSPGEGLTTYTDPLGWSVDLPTDWTITPIQTQDRVTTSGASFSSVPASDEANAVLPGDLSPVAPDAVEVVITHRSGGPAPDHTSDDSPFPLEAADMGCQDHGRWLICGVTVRGNGTDYSVEIRRGAEADADTLQAGEALIESLRFPALEPGDVSNDWLSLGSMDDYREGRGTAVYAGGRLDVVYVMRGPRGDYALDLEPESCGEGQNMTWDPEALQIWIECPAYTGTHDARYDRYGTPDPGNDPAFGRALKAYPIITSWDGSLLVYQAGTIDGLARTYWP